MTFRTPSRRPRPLRHASATGTALVVALGPVVVGALLARSVGGDPMVSVNALIAGGGQRARVSRDQLRSCRGRVNARRVRAVRGLRARTRLRSGASARSGGRVRAVRGLRARTRLRSAASARSGGRPGPRPAPSETRQT